MTHLAADARASRCADRRPRAGRAVGVLSITRGWPAAPSRSPSRWRGLRADFTPWFAFGWLGLDIFFILSGFLLTRQEWIRHERKGDANEARRRCGRFSAFCGTFLRKRILRVYPAYYGCLTLLMALAATQLYLRLPGAPGTRCCTWA